MAAPLATEDLLAGEEALSGFRASYFVVAADYGLKAHSGTPFARLFGIRGLESVSGTLHLTNWRLIFTAQGINRFTGSLEIALAEITVAKDISSGLKRAVQVATAATSHDFNLWGTTAFLSALEAQRAALDSAELARFTQARAAAPEPRRPFRPR